MIEVPHFKVGDLLIKTATHPVTHKIQNRRGMVLYIGNKGKTITVRWFHGDPGNPDERWMRNEEVVFQSKQLHKCVLTGEYDYHPTAT